MGRQGEVFALSREYLETARAAGDDAALIVGHRIHAVALLMRGDAEGARGLARQALQLYVPERHQPLIARFGQDLKVQGLNYLAVSEALLGRIGEARPSVTRRSGMPGASITSTRWRTRSGTAACGCRPSSARRTPCVATAPSCSTSHASTSWASGRRSRARFSWRGGGGTGGERLSTRVQRRVAVPELLCRVADIYVASGLTAEAVQSFR